MTMPSVTQSYRLLHIRSKCYEKISIPHLQVRSQVEFGQETPDAVTKRVWLLP
jgi:hypothetical protein